MPFFHPPSKLYTYPLLFCPYVNFPLMQQPLNKMESCYSLCIRLFKGDIIYQLVVFQRMCGQNCLGDTQSVCASQSSRWESHCTQGCINTLSDYKKFTKLTMQQACCGYRPDMLTNIMHIQNNS